MANTLRSNSELLGLVSEVPVDPVNRIDFSRQPPFDRPLFRERERAFLRDLITSLSPARSQVFNVRDAPFYALGDSVADDTAAITAAITACVAAGGGVVFFPPGIYKTTANIVVSLGDPHVGVKLVGVWGSTYIRPTAGVTIAFTFSCFSTSGDGQASRFIAEGISLDGAQTNGALGVVVGDNAAHISAYMVMRDFDIYGFHGAGAKGLYIKDIVGGLFDNVYVDRCTTDLYVSPSDPALPTVLSFRFCQFREADGNGIEIVNGYRMHFFQTVLESCFGRGLYALGGAAINVLWLEFDGLWCEGNCRNDASQYQIHMDGSAGGTLELRLANANWGGPSKSLYLKGVHNVILDNIYPNAAAGSVLIDTNVNGFVRNWPNNNVTYSTVVTNNSPTTFLNQDGNWARWYIDPATSALVVFSGAPAIGSVTNRFGKIYGTTLSHYYAQPAYGVAVAIDASGANFQQINATDGVAFTINAPTGMAASASMTLTIQVRNVSGGALGAVTWAGGWRLAGAWVSPANGFNRSITFVYDPGLARWYETNRSAADVAN